VRDEIEETPPTSRASPSSQPAWYRSPPFVLAALTAVLLLPFTGKAFHIDDPLFLWTAQHIREHPFDFYGFDVNWYGWPQRISDVAQNPPLASYYAALVGALFGFSERILHLAFLLPAALCIAGTWRLARRFTAEPVLAALVALLTPAFFVSSTSIMCDVLMLCLWVWTMVLWTAGLDRDSARLLSIAAVLVAATALSKFFGIALLPLLAAYTLARGGRARSRAVWLVIPLAILGAYQAWSQHLYGHGPFLQAAQFASGQHEKSAGPLHVALLQGLVFAGGCMLPVLCFAHTTWPRRAGIAFSLIGLAVAGFIVSRGAALFPGMRAQGAVGAWVFIELALFSAAGASILWLACADLAQRRDAESLLLALWVLGTFTFACFVNWTINARSLLPMAPAIGILVARRLDARNASLHANTDPAMESRVLPSLRTLLPLAPALLACLVLAWGDVALAAAGREAARAIAARNGQDEGRLFFEGHWGFQHYVEELGVPPLDYATFVLQPGDRVVIPRNTTNAQPLPRKTWEIAEHLEFPVAAWASTMSSDACAAFYASNFGFLPFTFGPAPNEVYDILRIVQPVAARH
jgi:4-amino-4-deoxy-L-arabinose transferase-like glycosyltransferase